MQDVDIASQVQQFYNVNDVCYGSNLSEQTHCQSRSTLKRSLDPCCSATLCYYTCSWETHKESKTDTLISNGFVFTTLNQRLPALQANFVSSGYLSSISHAPECALGSLFRSKTSQSFGQTADTINYISES